MVILTLLIWASIFALSGVLGFSIDWYQTAKALLKPIIFLTRIDIGLPPY